MTLRTQLSLLHAAFAIFAVLAAVATIYAVQLQIRDAATRFESLISRSNQVDTIRADVKTLDVHLHELVQGQRAANEEFAAYSETVLNHLAAVARFFDIRRSGASDLDALTKIVSSTRDPLNRCIQFAEKGDLTAAQRVFKNSIERPFEDADALLRKVGRRINVERQQATQHLVSRDTQLLFMALAIAAMGVGLVLSGALIVRRRLVQPIQSIQTATEAFARGDLQERVTVKSQDELGQLADSMNGMAAALRQSQRKYQSLFENLRDAVVICDRSGEIQECNNGDARLLVSGDEGCSGRNVADIWPQWRFHGQDWDELIERVITGDQPLRFSDVSIVAANGRTMPVDVVAYRVHYTDEPFVAIVIRDVAERHRLQEAARRSETMEAAVNFARGIAHDFKNLLHSAHVSLVGIRETAQATETIERATTAIEACRQAASLSKRLTRFSAADEGEPEPVHLAETVKFILDALDEDLFSGITLNVAIDAVDNQAGADAPAGVVLIDRDQLTQIVLNLVYNAIDAMPEGGALTISIHEQPFAHPLTGRPPTPHFVLRVEDTGCGIDPSALDHVFEPLYSTKPRTQGGPRGMGLAVVYAAVSHARGFVQIDSTPNQGATVLVYLPEFAEHAPANGVQPAARAERP